jgi:hypothetical protein
MMAIVRMDKQSTVKRIRQCRRTAVRSICKQRLRWEVDGTDLGKMKIKVFE